MTHPGPRDPRSTSTPLRSLGLLLAGLLLAIPTAVAAQEATDAPDPGTDSPTPELTWAPLVTIPPIVEPPILTPAELAEGYSLGDPEAPVVVEIWEDFQCPFCQRFSFQIKPLIVQAYVETGDARLVFRNLAFLGDESHWAAVAADLAAEQDRFWPFHDYLFANLQGENVGSFDLDRLLAMAEAAGLDMERFREGLVLEEARERFARIQAESRRDATALGINATPTVTVDGVPLQSPDFETVSAAIEAALGRGAGAGAASPSPGTDVPASPSPTAEG